MKKVDESLLFSASYIDRVAAKNINTQENVVECVECSRIRLYDGIRIWTVTDYERAGLWNGTENMMVTTC